MSPTAIIERPEIGKSERNRGLMTESISGGPAAESSAPATSDNSEPSPDAEASQPPAAGPRTKRPLWIWIAGGVLVLLALTKVVPYTINAFRTVSTDDAYVNGHVTFVAPRVPGQVVRVLVDDNNRVQRGNLLVQLDKQPYRVQVDIAKSRVGSGSSGSGRSPGEGSRTCRTRAQRTLRVGPVN